MSGLGTLQYAGDFRANAVEASARLLAHVAGDVDAVPVSSCTRFDDPANEPACRRIRWRLRFGSILGIALITGVMLLFALGIMTAEGLIVLIALVTCIGVLVFSLNEILWRTRAIRRIVQARGIDLDNATGSVLIENALTFSSMKLCPEDLALIWIDPRQRCLRVEGLSHRYRIYAADVVSLSVRRGPAQSSTSITYRIGRIDLALTLAENQPNLLEMYKQTVGRAPRLHAKLAEVLTATPEDQSIVDAIAQS